MRKHASWLTQSDERILELLRDEGARTPKVIRGQLAAAGMEYHDKHIGREARKLAKAGLLQNVGGGVYQITDDGMAYLDAELDATTIPDPRD